jgi:hypothetical protein
VPSIVKCTLDLVTYFEGGEDEITLLIMRYTLDLATGFSGKRNIYYNQNYQY